MSLKKYILVCVSFLLTAVPQNIIGCGGYEGNPYDYYYHFFRAHQWDKNYELQPFYYTGLSFLYSDIDEGNRTEELVREWKTYFGNNVKEEDIKNFIFADQTNNIQSLLIHLNKKSKFDAEPSFMSNTVTQYFLKSKDKNGLQYILYAKQVEPYVVGMDYEWNAPERDSVKMAALIEEGLKFYHQTNKAFYKLKYAYQVMRLAHYSGDYHRAISFYDAYISTNKTNSILHQLSLSLKAGALFRLGNTKEAAYYFSRVFSESDVMRKSNYIGFNWSVKWEEPMEEYLKMCKNDRERADMLAMFGFNTSDNAISILEEIYQIDPSSQSMEVLAVREINKAEEHYLTPMLYHQPGSASFLFYWWGYWNDVNIDRKSEVQELTDFLEKVGNDKRVKNQVLYNIGASYCAMMLQEYERAERLLNKVDVNTINESLQDQWQITRLLLTLNTSSKMDAKVEAIILPTLEWLDGKMISEDNSNAYGQDNYWGIVFRNLFSEILAKKYHAQQDPLKEMLCVGVAGLNDNFTSIDFFRKFSDAGLCMQLYSFFQSDNLTPFEKFIRSHNILNANTVSEFAGTAFIREQNYSEAIKWLDKDANAGSEINKNPFIELLYDREEWLPGDSVVTTKIAFAKEMLRLQKLIEKGNVEAMYRYALGLYNTTYYGYAWELVEYFRSGNDGYDLPKNATDFYKEYYGAHAAHDYFQKAYQASKDKEFKAKCLFMMAKCSQKDLQRPNYADYRDYEAYRIAENDYYFDFYNNIYFPQFVKEYGKTKFYQQAFNSCSYLRDFVKKQSK